MPERDVTSYMITYLPFKNTPVLRNIFISKAHVLRIMGVSLRKAPCVSLRVLSSFRISSINYYLVCHNICAFCGIFSTISVLLTTANSDNLDILVPDGSRSLKVTAVNSSYVIPISINCNRSRAPFMRYSLR